MISPYTHPNGTLTSAEAGQIKSWATVANGVIQIPSILTAESNLEKATTALATGVNVVAENADAKLGATFLSDFVSKYALALTALKK